MRNSKFQRTNAPLRGMFIKSAVLFINPTFLLNLQQESKKYTPSWIATNLFFEQECITSFFEGRYIHITLGVSDGKIIDQVDWWFSFMKENISYWIVYCIKENSIESLFSLLSKELLPSINSLKSVKFVCLYGFMHLPYASNWDNLR